MNHPISFFFGMNKNKHSQYRLDVLFSPCMNRIEMSFRDLKSKKSKERKPKESKSIRSGGGIVAKGPLQVGSAGPRSFVSQYEMDSDAEMYLASSLYGIRFKPTDRLPSKPKSTKSGGSASVSDPQQPSFLNPIHKKEMLDLIRHIESALNYHQTFEEVITSRSGGFSKTSAGREGHFISTTVKTPNGHSLSTNKNQHSSKTRVGGFAPTFQNTLPFHFDGYEEWERNYDAPVPLSVPTTSVPTNSVVHQSQFSQPHFVQTTQLQTMNPMLVPGINGTTSHPMVVPDAQQQYYENYYWQQLQQQRMEEEQLRKQLEEQQSAFQPHSTPLYPMATPTPISTQTTMPNWNLPPPPSYGRDEKTMGSNPLLQPMNGPPVITDFPEIPNFQAQPQIQAPMSTSSSKIWNLAQTIGLMNLQGYVLDKGQYLWDSIKNLSSYAWEKMSHVLTSENAVSVFNATVQYLKNVDSTTYLLSLAAFIALVMAIKLRAKWKPSELSAGQLKKNAVEMIQGMATLDTSQIVPNGVDLKQQMYDIIQQTDSLPDSTIPPNAAELKSKIVATLALITQLKNKISDR